jgi:hypothetical protein
MNSRDFTPTYVASIDESQEPECEDPRQDMEVTFPGDPLLKLWVLDVVKVRSMSFLIILQLVDALALLLVGVGHMEMQRGYDLAQSQLSLRLD